MVTTWAPTVSSIALQLLASAGGGAAVAFGLFKVFGERWLDQRYKSRAATEKYRMDRELEDLKARIQRQFDRVTKLSQREFEVLPEIWTKIVDAHSALEDVSMRLKRRLDLTKLPFEEVQAQLDALDLPASVRAQILAADGYRKNVLYWGLLERLDAGEVRGKAAEAHFALARLGIFLPANLHQQLATMKEFIWAAAIDYEQQTEMRADGTHVVIPDRPIEEFRKTGRQRLDEIENAVRNRLQSRPDEE